MINEPFKGSNKAPQRRAKAFGGARDRIVRTEIRLERAGRQIQGKNQELRNWSDAFTSPIMMQLGEDLQRDIAGHISEKVSEVISDAIKSDLKVSKILTATAMDRLIKLTGDNLAALVRDLILRDAQMQTHIDKDFSRDTFQAQDVIATKINIPAASVNVSYRVPPKWDL